MVSYLTSGGGAGRGKKRRKKNIFKSTKNPKKQHAEADKSTKNRKGSSQRLH